MLILLLFSVFAASLNSAVMHKANLTEKGAIYKFNLFSALVWCVLFSCQRRRRRVIYCR